MKQARTRAAQRGAARGAQRFGSARRFFFSPPAPTPTTPLMAPRCFSVQQLSLHVALLLSVPPTPLVLLLYSHKYSPTSVQSPSPRPILITPPQINTRPQTLFPSPPTPAPLHRFSLLHNTPDPVMFLQRATIAIKPPPPRMQNSWDSKSLFPRAGIGASVCEKI